MPRLLVQRVQAPLQRGAPEERLILRRVTRRTRPIGVVRAVGDGRDCRHHHAV